MTTIKEKKLTNFLREGGLEEGDFLRLKDDEVGLGFFKTIKNEFEKPIDKKKELGQFFTPSPISHLAAAFTIDENTQTLIDPMAGAGSMLRAGIQHLIKSGTDSTKLEALGIEIDKEVAIHSFLKLYEEFKNQDVSFEMVLSDAFHFSKATSNTKKYDVVLGNPPYVRYQNLTGYLSRFPSGLVNRFEKKLGNKNQSEVIDRVIRACLLDDFISRDLTSEELFELFESKGIRRELTEIENLWVELIKNYSGLSDLFLPSWLLTWNSVSSGGRVAFVTSDSWKSRDYADTLRYFLTRFFRPLYFIEQNCGWFENTLVGTSLIIVEARSKEEVLRPVSERKNEDENLIRKVRINDEYNLSKETGFSKFIKDFTEFKQESGSIVTNAKKIADFIGDQKTSYRDNLIDLEVINERKFTERWMTEVIKDSSVKKDKISKLETMGKLRNRNTVKKKITQYKEAILPGEICQLLEVEALNNNFISLEKAHVKPKQGLRTGCNPFFYLKETDDIEENIQARFLSENSTEVSENHKILKISDELGDGYISIPTEYLLPSVRYQNNFDEPVIQNTKDIKWYLFNSLNSASERDFNKLQQEYPDEWIEKWSIRDNLKPFPRSINEYIEHAEQVEIKRGGASKKVPDFTAVAPNSSKPKKPTEQSLFNEIPAVPSWWYSIPLNDRHFTKVFMPRVNDNVSEAYFVKPNKQVVIDANFSTFLIDETKAKFTNESLFAFLNSFWVKALLEKNATSMAGGALKIEASHLRNLPTPDFSDNAFKKLDTLGRKLVQNFHKEILGEIDELISKQVSNYCQLSSEEILDRLRNFFVEHKALRRNH